MPPPKPILLVTGVAGAGKTTIGRRLAVRLGVPFVDGDDLHPPSNRAKMAAGVPLDDGDRWPWLDAVRREIERALGSGVGLVISCSALKQGYRNRLLRPGEPVRIVHLSGPMELIAGRMRDRSDHFFPTTLLESQFADLEPPDGAIEPDIRLDPDELVARVIDALRSEPD